MISQNDDILIVDDKLENLRILSAILTEQGYKVRGAKNGQTALIMAHSQTPDMILLDIRMPGMDGFEVCKCLKADEQTQDIPVIFLSALDDVDIKVTAFSVGGWIMSPNPFMRRRFWSV